VETQVTYYRDDETREKRIENGVFRIDFPITFGASSVLLDSLARMRSIGIKDVTFTLDSPGGEAYESIAMYDIISAMPKDGMSTRMITLGACASAAVMIVLQGAQERLCLPNSRFLLHELRRAGIVHETASQMDEQTREIKRIQDCILDILSKRTGKTVKDIRKTISRKDVWMSAQEAIEYGLVDRITTELK